MELKLRSGAYVLNGAGLPETVDGAEETLQRALMRLSARRGSFAPAPDYGSRLYTLGTLKPSRRAAAARLFVTEALAVEKGVGVEAVDYVPGEGNSAAVAATLSLGGRTAEITLEV